MQPVTKETLKEKEIRLLLAITTPPDTPHPTSDQYRAFIFQVWGGMMMNPQSYGYFLSIIELNLKTLWPPPTPTPASNTDCKICNKEICTHGKITIRGNGIRRCNWCEEESDGPLPRYSLPFYEEKVDWNSETYFRVCKTCYTYSHIQKSLSEANISKEAKD